MRQHRSHTLKILILSPHRDDAANSLSIAITNWLNAHHTVTLMNVFTRSRYAPYSDAAFVHENDELSYVTAMRLREDELFVRRIKESLSKGLKKNLNMVDLNLKDAPIRLRIPREELNSTLVNPADSSIDKIRKALAKQSEAGMLEALVLPAALGNDVDHLTVRDAALALTASIPCAFFEDLPFAGLTLLRLLISKHSALPLPSATTLSQKFCMASANPVRLPSSASES